MSDVAVWLQGRERQCPCCKKLFTTYGCSDWGWQYNGQWCCSHKCMRKLERKNYRENPYASDFRENTKVASQATEHDLARVMELKAKGYRLQDISNATGFNINAVVRLLNRKTVVTSRGGKSPFSEKTVAQWVALHDSGMTYTEISKKTGISVTAIRNNVVKAMSRDEDCIRQS